MQEVIVRLSRYFQLFLIVAGLLPGTASSHHSYAGIDRDTVVELEGSVTHFDWRNPHVYIRVLVENEAGEPVEWEVESGGTPILVRSGWSRDSIVIGETIALQVYPERGSGRTYGVLQSLEKQDGTVLMQVARGSESTEKTVDLNGVWKSRVVPGSPIEPLSSLYEGFTELSQTEKGQQAISLYDNHADNPTAQCIGYSVLVTLASPHYLNEIEVLDDRVVIRNEWFDSERVIYTDGRAHPANGERSIQGHSTGEWEAGTLTVDTTLFAEHRSPYGTGLPSGLDKHVVERFRLNEDQTSLSIDVSMDDPEYLSQPFSGSLDWDFTPNLPMYRYDCDPGIASRFGPG
jgi:hypothetical protein